MVSRLTPVVLGKPWHTMPSESPTKMHSTPAASATAAKVETASWLAVSTMEWQVRPVRQGRGPAVAATMEVPVHQAPTVVRVALAGVAEMAAAPQELVAMAATAEIASDVSSH